jgi:hypothetical protein
MLCAGTKLNSVDESLSCSCTVCGRMSLSSVVCVCVCVRVCVPSLPVLMGCGHRVYHEDLKEVFLFTEAPETPTKWTRLWYLVQQPALLGLRDVNMMFKVTAMVIGRQPGVCVTYCGRARVIN